MHKIIANIFAGLAVSLVVLFYGPYIGNDTQSTNISTNTYFLFACGLISIFILAEGISLYPVRIYCLLSGSFLLLIAIVMTILVVNPGPIIVKEGWVDYIGPLLYVMALGILLTKDLPPHVISKTIVTDFVAYAGLKHVFIFFVPAAMITYIVWLAANYEITILNHASVFGVSLAITVLFAEGVTKYREKKWNATEGVEIKNKLDEINNSEN